MSLLSSSDIIGLPGVPESRMGVWKWLRSNAIPLNKSGNRFIFSLLDLPEDVQHAYRLKLAEEAGLAFGEQDDAAYIALASKPVGVQHTAHARAKVLGLVLKGRKAGLKWCQIAPQIKAASLGEVPSEQTVNRWFKRVEGVDPANWAPALAPDYKGRTVKAALSEEAWAFFENQIEASGGNGTGANFKRMWKATRTRAAAKGYLLSNAGDAFNYLFAVRTAGFDADECGFLGILDLCGQALRHAAEKEGEAIFALDRLLRDARANQTNQSLQPSV